MSDSAAFADLDLSRRLEIAEGRSSARCVDTRAGLEPQSGVTWQQIAGAYAMFDGVGSPLTQTFALGLTQTVGPDDLEALEQFFRQRGSDTMHEVSPLAGVELAALLVTFGYMPVEMTSVLFLPLATRPRLAGQVNPTLTVRRAEREEADIYAGITVRGWREFAAIGELGDRLARISLAHPDSMCVIAEAGGAPIATGAMFIHDGVALLAGATTVPEARRQGAQLALLDARLQFAQAAGCDVAMMGAAPGSASQRNAERHGFRVAYTRTKWQRS